MPAFSETEEHVRGRPHTAQVRTSWINVIIHEITVYQQRLTNLAQSLFLVLSGVSRQCIKRTTVLNAVLQCVCVCVFDCVVLKRP